MFFFCCCNAAAINCEFNAKLQLQTYNWVKVIHLNSFYKETWKKKKKKTFSVAETMYLGIWNHCRVKTKINQWAEITQLCHLEWSSSHSVNFSKLLGTDPDWTGRLQPPYLQASSNLTLCCVCYTSEITQRLHTSFKRRTRRVLEMSSGWLRRLKSSCYKKSCKDMLENGCCILTKACYGCCKTSGKCFFFFLKKKQHIVIRFLHNRQSVVDGRKMWCLIRIYDSW